MLLKVWRNAHLALAAVSSIFLVTATVSGLIISLAPIHHELSIPDASYNLADITINELKNNITQTHEDIFSIEQGLGQWVKVSTFDGDFYADAITGSKANVSYDVPAYFTFFINFHRSLFLKTPGRMMVTITAALLLLISITGILLLISKIGWHKIISPMEKVGGHSYYHSYLGRLNLIPIILISLSALILSSFRFELFSTKPQVIGMDTELIAGQYPLDYRTGDQLIKLEFPFSDDPADHFRLELASDSYEISQIDGSVVVHHNYPINKAINDLSYIVHTGQGSILWSAILFIASLNILYFMYTGFLISYKRLRKNSKNIYQAAEAETFIFIGSENGNTRIFGNILFEALQKVSKKVFLADLNQFQHYPKMKEILVLTSTYGDGEAPENANKFLELSANCQSNKPIHYSVAGFGSLQYPEFCSFAKLVDSSLEKHTGFIRSSNSAFINNSNYSEFRKWVDDWSLNNEISITIPQLLPRKSRRTQKVKLVNRLFDSDSDSIYIELKGSINNSFTSGDLVSIIPSGETFPRLYSAGKLRNGNLLLAIKRHKLGKTSQYLFDQNVDAAIEVSYVNNEQFHLPQSSNKVIMIANGTGIAPFIGMIQQEGQSRQIDLIWGSKTQSSINCLNSVSGFSKDNLHYICFALSREDHGYHHIQDVVTDKATTLIDELHKEATIMICGSIQMSKDVLNILDSKLKSKGHSGIDTFVKRGQILSDCY